MENQNNNKFKTELEAENEISINTKNEASNIIKFYGLFWDKEYLQEYAIEESSCNIMAGIPGGNVGKGTRGIEEKDKSLNFYRQKGIYILFNRDLIPVYTGQAGFQKSKKHKNNDDNQYLSDGGTIGDRLLTHKGSHFRHGWQFFSWFGILDHKDGKTLKTKNMEYSKRILSVEWNEYKNEELSRNTLLATLEAVLIYGFQPRFNSRGGDLGKAIYVNQYEGDPRSSG